MVCDTLCGSTEHFIDIGADRKASMALELKTSAVLSSSSCIRLWKWSPQWSRQPDSHMKREFVFAFRLVSLFYGRSQASLHQPLVISLKGHDTGYGGFNQPSYRASSTSCRSQYSHVIGWLSLPPTSAARPSMLLVLSQVNFCQCLTMMLNLSWSRRSNNAISAQSHGTEHHR